MTVYDSSVLIEYLTGHDDAVEYIESNLGRPAVTPQLALFEVYQGEVFKSEPADFDAVDGALSWLTPIEDCGGLARAAGELQAELHRNGEPLAPRDAMIAGTALTLDQRLAVADTDFAVEGLDGVIDVEFVGSLGETRSGG